MIIQLFLLVYFQYFCLLQLLAFAYSLILSGFKVKNYLKNILIIEIMAKPSLIYKNGNNFARHYK